MRSESIVLRGYVREDLETMFQLDMICFAEPFRFTKSAMRRFAEARKAQVSIAATSGGLVGFSIVHREQNGSQTLGYLVTLDVDPAWRRRGVARLLMEKAESQACAAGCTVMLLHVFAGNADAMAFYRKLGYVCVGEESGFYGQGMDAWVYQKHLAK